MNVLWLASWYPNRTDPSSGDFIERHAQAVAPFVNQLTVISIVKDETMAAGTVAIQEQARGNLLVLIAYYNTNGKGLLSKLFSQKKYHQLQQHLYQKVIQRFGDPDVVHVHVAMKAGLFALWLKRKYNHPYLVTEHWTGYFKESQPNIYQMGWFFKSLTNKVLKNAALLLPVTDHLGKTINANFVNTAYQVIPNAVDVNLFNYVPAAPDVFTFIHPSYMNYHKNPEGIIEASYLLKQQGYSFRIMMIGSEAESLKMLAKEHALLGEFIFFEKPIGYEMVAGRMKNSSALLLFSRYENLPCVILEALCTGLPVISSNVGGISEVINQRNGILVDKNNVASLATAMKDMIDHYRRYDNASISAEAISSYSYQKIGQQIATVYENIVVKK